MRDKFPFLRRRHTDSSLDGNGSDSRSGGRPTPADIVSWSKKFENLLADPSKYFMTSYYFWNDYLECVLWGDLTMLYITTWIQQIRMNLF